MNGDKKREKLDFIRIQILIFVRAKKACKNGIESAYVQNILDYELHGGKVS